MDKSARSPTIVDRYNKLVDQARNRRLPKDSSRPGIATVTNFGTFGIEWATPIPLPEQTLVLGMGAGRVAPHWDKAKGQFVPITEAHFTISFDHRVLDGGGAGRRCHGGLPPFCRNRRSCRERMKAEG